ncbi:oogenesin-3-like [Acomys russatus]|uniref:oogenesin-3-like n=1 Tax=Acomys russatus TaxID=60746 RepID=UPI0021E1ED15|nr:oogenesin-3-like [Acomys russatus]
MVPAWPFPCLPAGALIEEPHLETLKALLEGLDVMTAQKVPSEKSNFRVLDLRDVPHDFWSIWATESYEGDCSVPVTTQEQAVKTCPASGEETRFMVVTEFKIMKKGFNECDEYLLEWAQGRRNVIHLCCNKLRSWNSTLHLASSIWGQVNLGCIRELQLSEWCLEFIQDIEFHLGTMTNLHKLMLEEIRNSYNRATSVESTIKVLASTVFRAQHIRYLCLNDLCLLRNNLEKLFRNLDTRLETLSIASCWLSQADLDYLAHWPNICELKHLSLRDFIPESCPELLGVLLKRVASTLQTLDLEQCGLNDCHFNAILPALSHCSHLTKINFYYNNISLVVLKKLLHHTAKLSQLTEELYPAPRECYEEVIILRDRFEQLCPELLDILRAQRQPKAVSLAIPCFQCGHSCYYDLEARFCLCQQV